MAAGSTEGALCHARDPSTPLLSETLSPDIRASRPLTLLSVLCWRVQKEKEGGMGAGASAMLTAHPTDGIAAVKAGSPTRRTAASEPEASTPQVHSPPVAGTPLAAQLDLDM